MNIQNFPIKIAGFYHVYKKNSMAGKDLFGVDFTMVTVSPFAIYTNQKFSKIISNERNI